MIHSLMTWTLLITTPEGVEGRFLGSVSVGVAVGRCRVPSWCGRPYPEPCDEPPPLRDAENCIGMMVVVVDRPDK
jgi:hypothetical protein